MLNWLLTKDKQMTNKHMIRCFTLYVLREILMKTAMSYHCTSNRMAKFWNPDNTKWGRGCGATGTLIHCWWECKMVQPFWKMVWQFLTKLTYFYHMIQQWAPWYLSKGLKTCSHKNLHMMFIAALFVIARTWKQPRYPSVGEWINCGPSRQWNIIQIKKEWAIKPW